MDKFANLIFSALSLVLILVLHAATKVDAARFNTCAGLSRCPFDDLSADEIRAALQIINASFPFPDPRTIQYPVIRMQEPRKEDWLRGLPAGYVRRAEVQVFDLSSNTLVEMVVDLDAGRVSDVKPLPDGVLPSTMGAEYGVASQLILTNPQFLAAVQRRGLSLEDVRPLTWLPGPVESGGEGGGGRVFRAITGYQDPQTRFRNWRMVEGLIVNVDVHRGVVVSVWDDPGAPLTSLIEQEPNHDSKPPLTPLSISQPDGSSVQVEGQRLRWYKWRLQWSMDPIFGLQLFHVTYDGDCEERSVFYKMSMAEMFVPYGAAGRGWRWRSAFDAGEYSLGNLANELRIGVDVPENALLFDCLSVNDDGQPRIVSGCVAAFERDAGMLWKHEGEGRRGRELVLTMTTTVGNYDYAFDYVFHMDGTIDVQTRLTGIILSRGVNQRTGNETEPNCVANCTSLLSDYLDGPAHQHFFNYRIDFDVDGQTNQFLEAEVVADPIGPDNPNSGAFSPRRWVVPVEGWRDYDFRAHRSWHVVNAGSRNDHGSPRGYAIRPETISFTYLTDANPLLSHARFVEHPIWVTRYNDEEQTPADKYPRGGRAEEGLPKYVRDPESVVDEDLVVWYTYGVMHTTRPEEWPIMNVHKAGFSLLPYNFLSQNSEMALKDKCP